MDGFYLVNHGEFAKFAELSPCQSFPLCSVLLLCMILRMCRLLQVVRLSVNILLIIMKFFVACTIIVTCNVSMNNRIVKYIFLFVTGFVKIDPNHTGTEIHFTAEH